jgi:1,4-alpha-glucan branching enzyme
VDKDNNVVYREWAPNATEAYLIGEFSEYIHTEEHSESKLAADVTETIGIEDHIP